jgi:hypothetical protein
MRREDIQHALEAARTISPHSEFVVAGSLSVLGLLNTPPPEMSMSIDIDFYPLRDPQAAGDVIEFLGENSEFHERNGFYLDPISPELPVLPDGWKDRLVKVPMGKATAYFLDVNDTAVSKYARSADNDLRWLEAGYGAGLLDIEVIAARVRFGTNYYEAEDKRKTQNGLLMHRLAMREDGKFDADFLDYLHANAPVRNLQEADTEDRQYHGPILWSNDSHAVQSVGHGDVVVHITEGWDAVPETGRIATIKYRDGTHALSIERERGDLDLGR